MGINIGTSTTSANEVYVGTESIGEIYVGTELVWSKPVANTAPILFSISDGGSNTATAGSDVAISLPAGTTVTLTATAIDPEVTDGTQTLSYLWRRNNVQFGNYTGQGLTSQLTFTTSYFDIGLPWSFTCKITDSAGQGDQQSYFGDIHFVVTST